MLEAQNLTKYYSAVPAIRHVTFTLRRGSILGLLGPNGSGKSTTVSIIAGLLEPSGGRVLVDGVDIREDLVAYKARLGYVPEEAHLYNYLTGAEYLQLIGRLRGLPEPRLQRKVDVFLTTFNLAADRHAPLSAYSKGMRQKVLLAAALLHDPQIVVLDEPNSGLDVTTALVLRSLVQSLAADGRLVLYSSHVLEAIERLATEVVILNQGQVAAHGSVAELRRLMELPSLEQVFRRLAVEADVEDDAARLLEVMRA